MDFDTQLAIEVKKGARMWIIVPFRYKYLIFKQDGVDKWNAIVLNCEKKKLVNNMLNTMDS